MLSDHRTACGCGQGFECAKLLLHFHHIFIFSFSFSQIFLASLYRIHLFVYQRGTYCHLLGNVHIFIEIMVRKCSVTICKTINNMILIFLVLILNILRRKMKKTRNCIHKKNQNIVVNSNVKVVSSRLPHQRKMRHKADST